MKTILRLHLLVLVIATGWAHGAIVTFQFHDGTSDGGTLDAASEVFRDSVVDPGGATFDLVITATAETGTLVEGSSNTMAVQTSVSDTNVDAAGENVDFALTVENFMSGSSGFSQSDLQVGFRTFQLVAATGSTDSGTFDLINGSATSLTWIDGNGGSDFTGHGTNADFDLQVMNGGSLVTSFSHNYAGGAWRYDFGEVEYQFAVVPEPSSISLLSGVILLTGLLIRKRRQKPAMPIVHGG